EGEWTQDATDSVLPPVDPPASASFDQPQDEKEFLDSLNSAASDVAGPADPEPDSWSWMEEEWDWPGSARPTEPASPPEEDPAAQEDKDSPAISSPQDLQVQLERTLEKLSGHFGEDEGPSSLAPGNADLEEGAIPPLFDSKSPPPETPGDAGERTGSAEASADTPPVPSRSHSALLIERLKKLQAHLETRFRSLPSHPEPAAPDASSDSGTPGERVYDAARLGRPGTGKSKKDTEDYLDVLESFVFVQSQKNEP
ncbi:MAG: hypothetical protein GWM98_08625, partial [Nitrospinaceae bacterium]|nr:hypothetical protein [Nitrospinaceae bacterium]NIR54554.1 hypothetical protein [Nitrospinaceae bacterium]NIU96173.1 hypothetical protein [Nitrospinaceae bacterium]NIW58817.1 hypothetical protein [Nitrospinaceae bacterium]NIY14950.1 hypothetical protein [Nitrospinaceae bacterium]